MAFGFWNEGKFFKIELVLINVDLSPSSLVPGQTLSIPYAGNTIDIFETS